MADQYVLTNGMNFKDILSNYCVTCSLGSASHYFNFFFLYHHCRRKSLNILSRNYSVDGFSSTCFVAIWRYMYMYATLFNSYNHKFSLKLGVLDSLAWVQMPLSLQKLNQGWGVAVKTLGMKSILTTASFVNCTYSLCQNPNSHMSSHQVAAVLYQQKYYHYCHWFELIKTWCILLYFVFQVGCSKSLSCQKMAKQRSYVFQPEEK